MAVRAIVSLPPAVRRGEMFELRTTLQHPMETGYRRDSDGRLLARDIVRRLEVRMAGNVVFAADLHPAIAANPFVAITLVAQSGGPLECRWTGDNGFAHTETVTLNVT